MKLETLCERCRRRMELNSIYITDDVAVIGFLCRNCGVIVNLKSELEGIKEAMEFIKVLERWKV